MKKGTASRVKELGAFIILFMAVSMESCGVRNMYSREEPSRHRYIGARRTMRTTNTRKNSTIGSVILPSFPRSRQGPGYVLPH